MTMATPDPNPLPACLSHFAQRDRAVRERATKDALEAVAAHVEATGDRGWEWLAAKIRELDVPDRETTAT